MNLAATTRILPDYNKSVPDIFTEATKAMIMDDKRMNIICTLKEEIYLLHCIWTGHY
jgi:hypothetical protein